MDINESPVYVLLNPSINPAQKDLPVAIYESGMYLLFCCHQIPWKPAMELIPLVVIPYL